MPFVAVPDKNSGDVFTTAMWSTFLEGNLNGGVERPIYDTILGVATASIDITGIPQTFAHLEIIVAARSDTAALNTLLQLRFNGDTGANYYDQIGNVSNVTFGGAEDLGQNIGTVATIPAATATANCFGIIRLSVADYTNVARFKAWEATHSARWGTTTGLHNAGMHGGDWAAIAAITRITLLPAAGNFAAGSRVTLLGVPYL